MDQFYFEEGYIDANYFGYVAAGGATISSAFSPSFTVDIADATGYFINDYIDNGYIISGAVITADAAISAEFNIAVSGDRVRFGQCQSDSEFNQTLLSDRLRETGVALSFTSSLTGTISHIEGADIVLLPFAEMSATAKTTKDNIVNFAVISSIQASGGFTFKYSANLSCYASIVASPSKRYERPLELKGIVGPGLVEFRTSQKVFGTHSLYFNNNASGGKEVQYYANNSCIPGSGGFNGTFNYTTIIDFWVFIENTGLIVSFENEAGTQLWSLRRDLSSSRIAFSFLTPSGVTRTVSSLATFNSNQWNHVRIHNDGANFGVFLNGVNIGNEWSGGGITGNPTNKGLLIFGNATGVNTRFYIDEFRILRGNIGTLGSYNSSSITVPTERFINNENTQALLHFDNNYIDDVSLVEQGNANLNSSFNLSSKLSGPVKLESNTFNSLFSVSCNISKTLEIVLTAFGDSQLTALGGIIVPAIGNITSTASLDNQAEKITDIVEQLSTESSVAVDYLRIRDSAVAVDTVASQMSVVAVIADGIVFQEMVAVIVVEPVKTTDSTSVMFNTALISAFNTRSRDHSSTQDSLFDSNITADKITDIVSTGSSQFNQTVQAQAILVGTVSLDTDSTLSADPAGSTIDGAALVASLGTMSVDATRIQQAQAELDSESTVDADAIKAVFGEAALDSDAQLSATALRIQSGVIATDAVSAQMTVIAIIAEGITFQEVISLMSITAEKTTDIQAEFSATSTTDTVNDRFRLFDTAVDTAFTQTASGTLSTDARADFLSVFIQSTVAQKDTDIVLTAFGESQLTSTSSIVRGFDVDMQADSNTETAISILKQTAAELDSTADLVNNITVDYSVSLAFSANTQALITANILHLELHLYKIPREQRSFTIDREERLFGIYGETRTFKVRR